jgi:hypothetical protein
MKYAPPWLPPGSVGDPNASYVNGDPSIARQGSIPPGAAIEQPMRELVNIITKSIVIPTSEDLEQVSKCIRSQRMNYCEDTGAVNSLTVAVDPPLTGYTFGLTLHVKVKNTCTGPSTIDAGAGRAPIRKPTGAETSAGDLCAAGMVALVYDGTVFQMINFGGTTTGTGGGTISLTDMPYCLDTSTQRNLVIANFSPAITDLKAGTVFMVKIANTSNDTNNGACNINVNGLGNKPIFAMGCNTDWPMFPGDMQAGDVLVFAYDGTRFWILANVAIKESVTLNASTPLQVFNLFAALGRKRIATTGALRVLLAPGWYSNVSPTTFNLNQGTVIRTYHIDSDRITLEGTLNTGMKPPVPGDYSRTGSDETSRAYDANYNIYMIESRFATIIQARFGTGVEHVGPGMPTYKNLAVFGTYNVYSGEACIRVDNGCRVKCVDCQAVISADAGFAATSNAYMECYGCNAHQNATRGWAITGRSRAKIYGGSSCGNGMHGFEASHYGVILTYNYPAEPLSRIPLVIFNASCGGSAQSGTIVSFSGNWVVNASYDLLAWNQGVLMWLGSAADVISPALGTVGNYDALSNWLTGVVME